MWHYYYYYYFTNDVQSRDLLTYPKVIFGISTFVSVKTTVTDNLRSTRNILRNSRAPYISFVVILRNCETVSLTILLNTTTNIHICPNTLLEFKW